MSAQAIFTEKNNCQDCYKCIRRCPVKAIKVANHSASVVGDLCVYCGQCIKHCPVGAKRVRDDSARVQHLLDSEERVFISLAPSYQAEFSDFGKDKLINALYLMGAEGVSETALGAELVTSASTKYLEENDQNILISSCCPTVVELIHKYFPQHTGLIAPILSPMLAHAKFLKDVYGDDIKVVFIGPCISKKQEMEWHPGYIDVVMSFADLRNMLIESGLEPDFIHHKAAKLVPYSARRGNEYPIDGGMVNGVRAELKDKENVHLMSFTGINVIKDLFNGLDKIQGKEKVFLELMACEGGCINGPEFKNHQSIAKKKLDIVKNTDKRRPIQNITKDPLSLEIESAWGNNTRTPQNRHPESAIKDTLKVVGKVNEKDELNCGGCGYDSCRDFAIALLDKKAERSMCVSYMRQIAQNKATALLRKMPSGVVIVDENLQVVDSNIRFAEILGGDLPEIFKQKPGLAGAKLQKLISFHKIFAALIQSGEAQLERDVREGDRYMHASLFTIQPHRFVGAILRNMMEPEVKKDIVVKRTQEVIRKNMEVVQKIAYLMGENASFTETMLNSILDSHNPNEK